MRRRQYLPFPLNGGGGTGPSTSPPVATKARLTATISWPSRGRATNAPSSALSGQVTLQGAGSTGSDFVWKFNRDPNRPDAYIEQIQSPDTATAGVWNLNFSFFSQANGTGDIVAVANRSVTIGANGDLGDIAVSNAVASVEVAAGQKVAVGQQLPVVFTARSAQGTPLALSPQSGQVAVVSGQDKAGAVNGNSVRGVNAGLATVTVTVDGVSSAPQTVGVGQAMLTLNVSGPKGYVPLSVNQAGTTPAFFNIADIAPFTIPADWFAAATITAPDVYGDRQFSKWQFNGSDLSSSATTTYNALQAGTGTMTAIYVPRSATNGQYLPNFYQSSYKRWASFPVRVYFDTGNGVGAGQQALIRGAIDFWIAAAGDRFSYQVVTDPAQAQITYKFGATPSGVRGFCDSQWDGNNLMTHADITLSSDLQSGQEENLKIAARHEFGHALGLTGEQAGAGHSADSKDTMFATGNPSVGVITTRDINTMTTVYPDLLTRSVTTRQAGPTVEHGRNICK